MKQEEIIPLLTDTCGRLRSNLICKVTHKDSEGWKEEDMVLSGVIDDEGYFTSEYGSAYSSEFKPYLRSMSSMTEEERKELSNYENPVQRTDFFYSHHIDCRFMIEKGLALEAKEGMYD